MIIGLDPGPTESALVCWGSLGVGLHLIAANEDILRELAPIIPSDRVRVLVIEEIESFGMSVGREVFRTVFWAGRFAQAWHPRRFVMLPRRAVKLHLCQSMRAKDTNIRQALIDLLGPMGTKKNPGPTYGLKSHEWSALSLAVTYADQQNGAR